MTPLDQWIVDVKAAAEAAPKPAAPEEEMQIWSMNLVYGELLASSTISMLRFALAQCKAKGSESARYFVDLGSGEGVPVIAAGLAGFAKAEGIELLPKLHRKAQAHLEHAKLLIDRVPKLSDTPALETFVTAAESSTSATAAATAAPASPGSPASGGAGSATSSSDAAPASPKAVLITPTPAQPELDAVDAADAAARLERSVQLSCADFLEADWKAADVVFCNGTCYDIDVLEPLYKKAEALRPGAIFIITTHKMTSPVLFELLLEVAALPSSWGTVSLRVYRRKALPKWVSLVARNH